MRHPEYYCGRAEETRVIASVAKDPNVQHTLLGIAEDYENLCRLACEQKGLRYKPGRAPWLQPILIPAL